MDIIFSWHHSHTDGMGARFFYEGLLRKLNSTGADEKPLTLASRISKLTGVAQNFIPPQEKLGKYTVTPGYAVSTTWREVLPKMLVPESDTAASWAPIRSRPTQTQIRTFTIDEAMLQRVLAACRKNGATLTGLFHGTVLVSLAAQFSEGRAAGFEATTARNMRPSIPAEKPLYPWVKPSGMIGINVSIIEHKFGVKEVARIRAALRAASDGAGHMDALAEAVWSIAAGVRDDIRRGVDLGLKNTGAGLMGMVGDWRAQFKATMSKPRHHSWLVTNLGVLDGAGEEGAEWGIQKCRFSLSANVTGPAMHICAVAVKSGNLAVDVTCKDGVVHLEVGERLTADVQAWLRHFGK